MPIELAFIAAEVVVVVVAAWCCAAAVEDVQRAGQHMWSGAYCVALCFAKNPLLMLLSIMLYTQPVSSPSCHALMSTLRSSSHAALCCTPLCASPCHASASRPRRSPQSDQPVPAPEQTETDRYFNGAIPPPFPDPSSGQGDDAGGEGGGGGKSSSADYVIGGEAGIEGGGGGEEGGVGVMGQGLGYGRASLGGREGGEMRRRVAEEEEEGEEEGERRRRLCRERGERWWQLHRWLPYPNT